MAGRCSWVLLLWLLQAAAVLGTEDGTSLDELQPLPSLPEMSTDMVVSLDQLDMGALKPAQAQQQTQPVSNETKQDPEPKQQAVEDLKLEAKSDEVHQNTTDTAPKVVDQTRAANNRTEPGTQQEADASEEAEGIQAVDGASENATTVEQATDDAKAVVAPAVEEQEGEEDPKAVEEQEHAAALARVNSTKVPEAIGCYYDLVANADAQKALAERLDEKVLDLTEQLGSAKHAANQSLEATRRFEQKVKMVTEAHDEAAKEYRTEHSAALNLFARAKGNLNSYDVERKKVDLDSSRSKQVLQKYLEFKKKYIQASADTDDPTTSREVLQYQKLAKQYLASYDTLQTSIKTAYTAAKKFSDAYTTQSEQYQKLALKANDLAKDVARTSSELVKTRLALQGHQSDYSTHSTAAQRYAYQLTQAQDAAEVSNARFEAQQQQAGMAKVAWIKFEALAERYGRMADEGARKEQLNKVRMFNLEMEVKRTTSEMEASVKSVALLKRKYETAEAAGMVFTKSYRANGCEARIAAVGAAAVNKSGGLVSALQEEPKEEEYSAAQCENDRKVASENLDAAEAAKQAHQQELAHLHVLKEDHATSMSGVKTAKAIMAGAGSKVHKYRQVAQQAAEHAKNPCDAVNKKPQSSYYY
eukprot:TRINITY_DN752_c0_g2_i2.p1 TRINITY_DN752_c0_g2~~TRINITY_DN752_c0_g2_i2.p1  ORF type:complete len:644 (+),score=219.00 TRINITY_DN752_c0_g2_i2:198-2129(+)